jgi:hypothetical protein
MTVQNKIYGRAILDVGVIETDFDSKPKIIIGDAGPEWRLNQDILIDHELDISILDDFFAQLEKLGPMEKIRYEMGLSPREGYRDGLVLRHSDRPEILCHVRVFSGPKNYTPNPNIYHYPYDAVLYLYLDFDRLGSEENRELENEIRIQQALSNHHIDGDGYRYVNSDEYAQVDESKEVPLLDTDDFEDFASDFYDQLVK